MTPRMVAAAAAAAAAVVYVAAAYHCNVCYSVGVAERIVAAPLAVVPWSDNDGHHLRLHLDWDVAFACAFDCRGRDVAKAAFS